MTVACLGDSITEGDYGVFGKRGIANVHTENYPYFLAKHTGWTVKNFGKCGFRASDFLSYYESGQVDVSGADLILILLGANGGLSAMENNEENEAYRRLVAHCLADAPKAKLVLLTPTHVTVNPAFSNCGYIDNVTSGAEFTRQLAKEEHLSLIETAHIPAFTEENETVYQANDGLHFVAAGYEILAKFILNELKKF